MAIVVREKVESRRFKGGASTQPTVERLYWVRGAADEFAALRAVTISPDCPATWDIYQDGSVIMYRYDYDVSTRDGQTFDVTINYHVLPSQQNAVYEFDTVSSSEQVKWALSRVTGYVKTGISISAIDARGAINWTPNGIEGTSILAPKREWSEKHSLPSTIVTRAYQDILADYAGKVNSGTFRGFAAGEVLFIGARGSIAGFDERWEITFQFAASKNCSIANGTSITVGQIANIEKKGWEYLTIHTQKCEDLQHVLLDEPWCVEVLKVYDERDFADLQIGVA